MKTFFLLMFIPAVAFSQLKKLANTAKDIADAAELAAIAVDIIESTSFTLDKLKSCEKELDQLKELIDDPKVQRYMSKGKSRAWADEVRGVTTNVRLYSTLIAASLRRLGSIEKSLLVKNAGKVAGAITSAISSGGNKASAPVVEAVDEVGQGVEKTSIEQSLVSFLLKIDAFNTDVDALVAETSRLSESLGAELGFAVVMSMPGSTIRDYASRRSLKVE